VPSSAPPTLPFAARLRAVGTLGRLALKGDAAAGDVICILVAGVVTCIECCAEMRERDAPMLWRPRLSVASSLMVEVMVVPCRGCRVSMCEV